MNLSLAVLIILTMTSEVTSADSLALETTRTCFFAQGEGLPNTQVKERHTSQSGCKPVRGNGKLRRSGNYALKATYGFADEGEPVLNITWYPITRKRGSQLVYPNKHIVEIKLLNQKLETIDTLCVTLRTEWKYFNSSKDIARLHYDCLKLLDTPEDTTVSVRVISVNRNACSGRSKRSIESKDTRCDADCSDKMYFPIDKGYYKPKICADAPPPSIDAFIQTLDTGSYIRVVSGPVPPYTEIVEVKVANGSFDDATSRTAYLENPPLGNISFDIPFSSPGEYRVAVHYFCSQSIHDSAAFSIQKKDPVTMVSPPQQKKQTEIVIAIAVVSAVGGTAFITSVAFFVIHAFRKSQKRNINVTDLYVPEIRRGPTYCPRALDRSRKKSAAMALYHPDNQYHQEAFEILCSLLKGFGVSIEHSNFDNWRDFAESAGVEYTDIVIVLSNDLYTTVHEYRANTSTPSEEYERLINIRGHDIANVALEALKVRATGPPASCRFVIHLVSFGYTSGSAQRLEQLFLDDHGLYFNRSNTLLYDVAQYKPVDQTAVLNKDHLRSLVKYLTYGETELSDQQLNSVSQSFIDNISSALRLSRQNACSSLGGPSERLLNNNRTLPQHGEEEPPVSLDELQLEMKNFNS